MLPNSNMYHLGKVISRWFRDLQARIWLPLASLNWVLCVVAVGMNRKCEPIGHLWCGKPVPVSRGEINSPWWQQTRTIVRGWSPAPKSRTTWQIPWNLLKIQKRILIFLHDKIIFFDLDFFPWQGMIIYDHLLPQNNTYSNPMGHWKKIPIFGGKLLIFCSIWHICYL